ncbi:Hypothetical predicted protein [Paramuricea clavata]|uniref:Uncharacterized protein n=1 Tax=Paramuricea clavata TaxID=317549 RepID=A0A7D9HPZ6_PARCT|nr:Hypothetical predicted protein [Paramuricea clavata]
MEENKILKMSIQQLERSVTTLDQAHNDLEQYGQGSVLRFAESLLPGPGQSENVNAVVSNVGKLIGVDVKREDISLCHRLP